MNELFKAAIFIIFVKLNIILHKQFVKMSENNSDW